MVEFQKKIEALGALLDESKKNIVVLGHTNPDGDAIGSVLAWSEILELKGHNVTRVVPNKFPYFLDWMTGINQILIYKDDKDGVITSAVENADIIFCMDFNQINRLEHLTETIDANKSAKRILIDHHLDPPQEYDIEFSYPESSSTAFLTYKIIDALYGHEIISKAMCEALYVGLMTDTGNFSFSNLTPELFRTVAALLEKGINIPYINAAVYCNFTEGRTRLLGYALYSKMEIMREQGAAFIALTEEEVRRFKFQQGDSEGFVNYPLTIRGISMTAMFLETKQFIRVSLRSRGDVDVNVFARKYFEGGGHKNASGGKSFLPMDQTVDKYKKAVREFIKNSSK